MTGVPVIIFLSAAVALGLFNLVMLLRRDRKAVAIGLHLLLGLGGLMALVFFLRDASNGEGVPAGAFGNVAAGLLALAAFSGLVGPLVAPRSKPAAYLLLAAHAGCGLAGFLACLAWAYST
jgi:hypothetical protein